MYRTSSHPQCLWPFTTRNVDLKKPLVKTLWIFVSQAKWHFHLVFTVHHKFIVNWITWFHDLLVGSHCSPWHYSNLGLLSELKPFSHDAEKTLKAWENISDEKLNKSAIVWKVSNAWGQTSLVNPWEILYSRRSRPLTNLPLAEDFTRDPWQLIVWREALFMVRHPKLLWKFSLKPWEFFSASSEKGLREYPWYRTHTATAW